MTYTSILVETRGKVGLITLNRPQAMNALNNQLLRELMDALEAFDKDDDIGATVITGNKKAFAAGERPPVSICRCRSQRCPNSCCNTRSMVRERSLWNSAAVLQGKSTGWSSAPTRFGSARQKSPCR